MFVSDLEPGDTFSRPGHPYEVYMKVRPKFNEQLIVQVEHDNIKYPVSSENCAAVHLSGKNIGLLVFLTETEVETV